jgi:hypothetical protein
MSDIDQGTGMLAGRDSFVLSPDITLSLAGLAGRQSTHWQSLYSDFEGDSKLKLQEVTTLTSRVTSTPHSAIA